MSFTAFKYQHDASRVLTAKRKIFVYVMLACALALTVLIFPLGACAFIFPLLVYLTTNRQLLLGPRYLLCGQQIVYYANVTHMRLSASKGLLRLQLVSGKTFILDKNKFPTNARKSAKIAKNQTIKFAKLSAKIVEKVRAAQPAVEWSEE